jgi:hypothetical protein
MTFGIGKKDPAHQLLTGEDCDQVQPIKVKNAKVSNAHKPKHSSYTKLFGFVPNAKIEESKECVECRRTYTPDFSNPGSQKAANICHSCLNFKIIG